MTHVVTISAALLGLALLGAPSHAAAQRAQRVAEGPIRVGETVRGELTAADAKLDNGNTFRLYRFTADSGKRYALTLHSTAFDPYVRVERPIGPITSAAASDDDDGPGTDALLYHRMRAGGMYYVVVISLDSLGAFELALRELPDQPLTPRPLAIGDTARGTLGESSAVDDEDRPMEMYTFQAAAGQRLRASLSGDSLEAYLAIGQMTDGMFTPIVDSSGSARDSSSTRASRNRSGTATRDAGRRKVATYIATIPAAGTYAVRVLAQSTTAAGRYTVRVVHDSVSEETVADEEAAAEDEPTENDRPAPPARRAVAGDSLRGILSDSSGRAGRQHFEEWIYAARQGERLTIAMLSDDFDPYVAIGRRVEGAFQKLGEDDDGGSGLSAQLAFTVPEDGEYVVRAGEAPGRLSSLSGEGAYVLRLTSRAPVTHRLQRARIAAGPAVESQLEEADEAAEDGSPYDEWIYTAARDERFIVTMISREFDAYLSVGRMDNDRFVEFAINDDAVGLDTDSIRIARVIIVAPAAGEFVIRANTFGPDQKGAYTIQVERATALGARAAPRRSVRR